MVRPKNGTISNYTKVCSYSDMKYKTSKRKRVVDVFNFFFNALPPDGHLSLEELHVIVHEIWLTRHDEELEHERATRRKGRPKSTREHKLEEIKIREADEYRTGLGELTCHFQYLSVI